MSASADTAALLTPPGPAGLALVRLRGPRVPEALARFTPAAVRQPPMSGVARRATLLDHDGAALDDILVSVLSSGPEWDAIWHLHGSPGVTARCLEMLGEAGFAVAHDAAGGFFAVQDLIEAEALAALPRIQTEAGVHWLLNAVRCLRAELQRIAALPGDDEARAALDRLPDARPQLAAYCTPLRIALLGPPNAGKSTLINALTDRPVSIVSPRPGTTRDWVEAPGELRGYPVLWIDTAGVRPTDHPLEAGGVARALTTAADADATLVVLDGTRRAAEARREFITRLSIGPPVAVALNKCDEPDFEAAAASAELPAEWNRAAVSISATRRTGLEALDDVVLRGTGRLAAMATPGAFSDSLVLYLHALSRRNQGAVTEISVRAELANLLATAPR